MSSFFSLSPRSLAALGLMTLTTALTTAQATQLELSATQPLSARVGLSDFQAFGSRWGAGVLVRGSTFGVDASVSQGLALPLGAVSVVSRAQVAWGAADARGWRWESRATGAIGPVALNLGLGHFTTPVTTFDPLAGWTLDAADLRSVGWHGDLSGRYRLSRTLVGVAGAEWGGQNLYSLGVESRRDLTRPLPPAQEDAAEGDDPAAPPETERIGALTYRAGLRAGRDVLGLTGGVTYATESGQTLALDVQLGAKAGAVASLSWPEVWGEGSTLNVYAAYEPWREYSTPLRVGLEGSHPLGRGTLNVALRGGKTAAGEKSAGLSVGYTLPLGGER